MQAEEILIKAKKVLTNFLKAVIIINIKLIELYEFFKTNEICVSGREVRRQQTVNLPSESPSQVRVLSGTIRYLQYPNIIWFHRKTGLFHSPFKAKFRVRASMELYSSKR